MPQLKAAKKALRTDARRRTVNDRWRKQVREAIHAVRDAVAAKDKKTSQTALIKAQSTIDRATRRHIIHHNKASHLKQKLSQAVNQAK